MAAMRASTLRIVGLGVATDAPGTATASVAPIAPTAARAPRRRRSRESRLVWENWVWAGSTRQAVVKTAVLLLPVRLPGELTGSGGKLALQRRSRHRPAGRRHGRVADSPREPGSPA